MSSYALEIAQATPQQTPQPTLRETPPETPPSEAPCHSILSSQECYLKEWILASTEDEGEKRQRDQHRCEVCGQIPNNPVEFIFREPNRPRETIKIVGKQCLDKHLKSSHYEKYRTSENALQHCTIQDYTVMCPFQYDEERRHRREDIINDERTCTFVGQLRNVEQHLKNDCPWRQVNCQFHIYGCTDMLYQYAVADHMTSHMAAHLRLSLQYILQLEMRIQQLEGIEMKYDEINEQERLEGLSCEEMPTILPQIRHLMNKRDYLIVRNNNEKVKLSNKELVKYRYGIYVLGHNVTIICETKDGDYAHLRLEVSHFYIQHKSSSIDLSGSGCPSDGGLGKGSQSHFGSGAGYGTIGGSDDGQKTIPPSGGTYGEPTLLKQIHPGSGGGSGSGYKGGSGGGIIELYIKHQIVNNGSIKCNGNNGQSAVFKKNGCGGGGSGGSILIRFQNPNPALPQLLGNISCSGGNQKLKNRGGDGRIAIYGIKISPEQKARIIPEPHLGEES